MYLSIGTLVPSNPFVIPVRLSVFHKQFGAESSSPLFGQGLRVQYASPWTKHSWGSSGFPGPCLVRSFNALTVIALEFGNSCGQVVIQINRNITTNVYALEQSSQKLILRSLPSADARVFSYWGSFPERRLFCKPFPSYVIFRFMTEIASFQMRDGLKLPSVSCLIRWIMQAVLVVVIRAELLHKTGEAEGLHTKEKQIPSSNRLKSY